MIRRVVTIIAVALAFPTISFAQGGGAQEVRQNWQEIAASISAAGNEDAAARIRTAVDALSDKDLERAHGQLNFGTMHNALKEIGTAVNAVNSLGGIKSAEALQGQSVSTPSPSVSAITSATPLVTSVDFPTANYPSNTVCPYSPDRSNGEALQIATTSIKAARVALEVAKGVWAGLSRACDETVVILGEGGNASLACIPADIALFVAEGLVGAAEGTVEYFGACDNGVDSAEVAGTWAGVKHIHTDLTEQTNQLTAHDTRLAVHDTDIKAKLEQQKGMLDQQKVMLEAVLANQKEIIKLLKTPEGRRPGWNVLGY